MAQGQSSRRLFQFPQPRKSKVNWHWGNSLIDLRSFELTKTLWQGHTPPRDPKDLNKTSQGPKIEWDSVRTDSLCKHFYCFFVFIYFVVSALLSHAHLKFEPLPTASSAICMRNIHTIFRRRNPGWFYSLLTFYISVPFPWHAKGSRVECNKMVCYRFLV